PPAFSLFPYTTLFRSIRAATSRDPEDPRPAAQHPRRSPDPHYRWGCGVSAEKLITEHLNLWTGAIAKKSSSGRGSSSKIELSGIDRKSTRLNSSHVKI